MLDHVPDIEETNTRPNVLMRIACMRGERGESYVKKRRRIWDHSGERTVLQDPRCSVRGQSHALYSMVRHPVNACEDFARVYMVRARAIGFTSFAGSLVRSGKKRQLKHTVTNAVVPQGHIVPSKRHQLRLVLDVKIVEASPL